MENTSLSKRSTTLLTLAAAALVMIGFAFLGVTYGGRLRLAHHVGYAVVAFLFAFGLFALARRSRAQGTDLVWDIGLAALLPFVVGPLLSRVFGQRYTQ